MPRQFATYTNYTVLTNYFDKVVYGSGGDDTLAGGYGQRPALRVRRQ